MVEQTASRSGAKVTVACKLPNGLILRLMEEQEHNEPLLGGGYKPVKQYRATGETVTIRGNAVPHGRTPRHRIVLPDNAPGEEGAPFTEGYALTPGVSKDFWEKWLSQNGELEIVKNRIIFACDSEDAAEKRALNNLRVRSGLEPVNPEGDPRAPRSRVKGLKVTKGERDED